MAKATIRKLKADRFWRWLCVEVYGKPSPKKPIKQDKRKPKLNRRKFQRSVEKLVKAIRAAKGK